MRNPLKKKVEEEDGPTTEEVEEEEYTEEYEPIKKHLSNPLKRKKETPRETEGSIIEREITLSLLNDKLNYLISQVAAIVKAFEE